MYFIYDYSTQEWIGGKFNSLEDAAKFQVTYLALAQFHGSTVTAKDVPILQEVLYVV